MGCGTSSLNRKIKAISRPQSTVKYNKNSIAQSLFQDPDFLCSSILTQNNNTLHITWLRPHQIVSNPQLYVDGTSRRDVIQGILGDCWLLSTCAAIAKKEELLHRVLPPNQVLYGPEYTGAIKFRIWQFGHWHDVVIDDRLPLVNGKYIYGHCADPTEFWVALIEKAFAKIHGSYENLEGGMPIEAMVDLTGGLAERYELSKMRENLYDYIRQSFSANAFITCSRKGDWRQAHASDVNGLVQGHAYTITGIYRIYVDNVLCYLVRIRNPWGDNNEWKGEWSDQNDNWNKVDDETKRKIGLRYKADGEFWMDYFKDFVHEFEEVSICTMGPDFDHDGQVDNANCTMTIHGAWVANVNAGGCRNNFELFATNPKIKLTVMHETNQVIVSLAQRKVPGSKLHQIGFTIYYANESDIYDEDYFKNQKALATSGSYINYREVFGRFTLSEGDYVIIPATFTPNIEAKYLLRIFSEENINLIELN